MTGTTLLAIGLLGFAVLLGLALMEQRRVAAALRQRLLLPILGLGVIAQGLLALQGSDEERTFAFGLALSLLVGIGFVIVVVTRLREGPR